MSIRQRAHHTHGAAADPCEKAENPVCSAEMNKAGALQPSHMKPER